MSVVCKVKSEKRKNKKNVLVTTDCMFAFYFCRKVYNVLQFSLPPYFHYFLSLITVFASHTCS